MNAEISIGAAAINYMTGIINAWMTSQGKELSSKDKAEIAKFAKTQVKGKEVVESESTEKDPSSEESQEEKPTVYILLNSSAKEHGVFFQPKDEEEVDKILTSLEAGQTRKKIGKKFEGFGLPQDQLAAAKKALKKKFSVVEKEFKGFEDPWAEKTKKMVSGKEKAKAKGKATTGKAKPGPTGKAEKAGLVKNKWGNLWDEKTKAVFVEFETVDEDQKKTGETCLAFVGMQNVKAPVNAKSKEEPWSTVVPGGKKPSTSFKFEVLTNDLAQTCADQKMFDRFYEADLLVKDESDEEKEEEEEKETSE